MSARVIPADPSGAIEAPVALVEMLREATDIVVLTGAGMSAESGVPTFRDAVTGLWSHVDPMAMATPEAFEDDPQQVHAWYRWRAELVGRAQPNAGHAALARLGDARRVRVVTQNVDDLHERAGSTDVAHLHGSLFAPRCAECGRPWPAGDSAGHVSADRVPEEVPSCAGCGGLVRPGVVWFGEGLPMDVFDDASRACEEADVLLVVGTSGIVHPAASLPVVAFGAGTRVVEINPDETQISDVSALCWRETAARALPALVEALGD